MSFFSDPKLFLVWGRQMGCKFYIYRIQTKPGCPIAAGEFGAYEVLNFTKHLSLPHNKESDFGSLFAYLRKNDKFVNCQGIVINWFSNDRIGRHSWSWSPEGLNLSNYGIHALVSPQEHWMIGHAIPSNLVPFEDLDVLSTFPRNTPLTITKAIPTTLVLGEDKSTNVRVSRFCGAVYPIVIVDVDELVPDKENARFDPDIWGLFQNAGTSYASRKPFESEML